MLRIEGFIIILILLLSYSCINKSAPERISLEGMSELEVDYALNHPDGIKKKDLQRDLGHIVKNYIDTVNLDNYFREKPEREFLQTEIKKFYEKIDYQLAWNSTDGPLSISGELTGILGQVYKVGLNPEDYDVENIIKSQRTLFQHGGIASSLRGLLELDVHMTTRYLLLGYHMNRGRIDPVEILEAWYVEAEKIPISEILYQGVADGNLSEALNKLEPQDEGYVQLKEYFLKYYNLLQSNVDDIQLSQDLINIAPDDTSRNIVHLKKKLMMLGDLKEERNPTNEFNDVLQKALTHFQERHGLEATGIVDNATLNELQVPIRDRLQIININLERIKWFPEFEERYIVVNVPEFKMKLYDNGKKELEMKAIVGREVNPTPVMTEEMTYIVFNPTWTVPTSITTEELLPKIQEDVSYLKRNNYSVYDGWGSNANKLDPEDIDFEDYTEEDFPYVIVQEPGPNNALGQVQFMMPNNLAIYLHDTPAGHLFDREERAFSHGCVRLERPLELADYLLQERQGWDRSDMDQALAQDDPVNVTLPEEWPVHLIYQTAWVDENGLLNFREDVYGLDAEQLAALERLDLNFPIVRK
jgi:L,D-transpeptidase YcbB